MFDLKCVLKSINIEKRELLTKGSNGIVVNFDFGEDWNNLTKTVIFKYGDQQKDMILTGTQTTIPWECIDNIGDEIIVGVYGANTDGTIVIPTLYAKLGNVVEGADPSGDESYEKTKDVVAQVIAIAEAANTKSETVLQAYKAGELKGEPGYTPVKGIDYLDGKDGYTPVKGKDYFDGQPGYTPIKGIDYTDGQPGAPGHTPIKGKDYWTEADQTAINADIDRKIEAETATLNEALATQIPIEVNKAVDEKTSEFVKQSYVDGELAKKQNNLTAGENITIENGVISATGSGSAEVEHIADISLDEMVNAFTVDLGGRFKEVHIVTSSIVGQSTANDNLFLILNDYLDDWSSNGYIPATQTIPLPQYGRTHYLTLKAFPYGCLEEDWMLAADYNGTATYHSMFKARMNDGYINKIKLRFQRAESLFSTSAVFKFYGVRA